MFATGVWSARGGKPTLGVDIACTKISIDLQNMRRGGVEGSIRESLNSLRDSSGVDTAFVWLFSPDGSTIAFQRELKHFDVDGYDVLASWRST